MYFSQLSKKKMIFGKNAKEKPAVSEETAGLNPSFYGNQASAEALSLITRMLLIFCSTMGLSL